MDDANTAAATVAAIKKQLGEGYVIIARHMKRAAWENRAKRRNALCDMSGRGWSVVDIAFVKVGGEDVVWIHFVQEEDEKGSSTVTT